jgi:phosphatidylinositol-3-phosphatase
METPATHTVLRTQTLRLFPATLVAFCIAACGGSAKINAPTTSDGVTVSCAPGIMAPSTTSQCSAKFAGGMSATITWSASAGTITSAGLFTAPSSTGSVTITAANAQNTAQAGTETLTVQLKTPPSQHVVLLMEENQDYTTTFGNNAGWPNLNKLIQRGSVATNYYADVHPSIGNYFMLTTGQVLTTDDSSTAIWKVDNIARRMFANNVTFKVYAEGIPRGYLGGNLGAYLLRHNPFALLSDVAASPQVASQVIWPFSQFAADVANNALPQFSFIVPDADDDAHSGTQQQADTWMQTNVVAPLASLPAFQSGGDGVLIIDFDEGAGNDTANGGGHVSPVFWGPLAASGYQQKSSVLYQHESMLRTIMDVLNLANPPGNAANAPDMAEFFVQK